MMCKSPNKALLKCLKNKSDTSLSCWSIVEHNGMKFSMRKNSTNCFHNASTEYLVKNVVREFNRNENFQIKKNSLIKRFSTVAINETHLTKEQVNQVTTKTDNITTSNNHSIFKNPNAIVFFNKEETETVGQKIYRYLDITGFLTRYNSRKDWILDLDPYTRISAVLLTEYERKLMIFLKFHVYLLFVICLYLWYHAQVHFTMKPPCPKPYAYGHLDGRKRDFTWHGRLFFMYPKMRCKDCRWLDVQCKKECFEKLKLEGHKFIINKGDPLSVPKTVLYPSHFH